MATRPFRAVAVDTDLVKVWCVLPIRDLVQLAKFDLNEARRARLERFIKVRRWRLEKRARSNITGEARR